MKITNPQTTEKSFANEEWRPVPNYEGLYEVSSYGRLRRLSKSRMAPAGYIMKPWVRKCGYWKYGLSKNNKYWHVEAHRLVAITFLGPPPFPNAQAAHYDGNPGNNHISNIRWATPKENEADKKRHGTAKTAQPGEKHHMAKLSEAIVGKMRMLVASGKRITDVAREMSIPKLTAYDAIVGNTWKTILKPAPIPCKRRTV